MHKKETHKLSSAYKGTVQAVMSAGLGTPKADPGLTVIYTEGYAPEGLDVVSNAGVAVGINEFGFLEPCNGTIKPYGIVADALIGTACAFEDGDRSKPLYPHMNGQESLHQETPTVYQAATLFEVGRSFKKGKADSALFDVEVGDLLRPITTAEITTALASGGALEGLKVKLGGKVLTAAQLRAYLAGMLVKFDAANDDAAMKCGRVAAIVNPGTYENYAYNGQWIFEGYDVQGPGTNGHSRNVWNTISETRTNVEFTTQILQFYVTM